MSQSILVAYGKQYRVKVSDFIDVDAANKESISEGDHILFDVLLLIEEGNVEIGAPFVLGKKAVCKVIGLTKGPKGFSYKYKRRKGYQRKVGFRHQYIRVQVEKFISEEL